MSQEAAVIVVGVAQQKGGTGKTTLCINLSVALEAMGYRPTYILDLDPAQALDDWTDRRVEARPFRLDMAAHQMERMFQRWREDPGIVLVDTPGTISREVATVLRVADYVLVPCQPSPLDVRVSGGTVDLLEVQHRKNFAFVLNRVIPRSRLVAPAIKRLSQAGTVCPHHLGQRQDFQLAAGLGRGVVETEPWGPSAMEVKQVTSWLLAELYRIRGVSPTGEPAELVGEVG